MDPNLIVFSLIGLLSLGLLQWVSQRFRRSNSRDLSYPPGPPESFILGNLRDLPSSCAWLTFTDWRKKYGDIFHFRVLGKHTVVLNSYEDCVALMEKRSGLYSDRPVMPMMDLMGWTDISAALMRYGTRWRLHKRLFQQFLKQDISLTYRPTQTRKVNDLLYGLLTTPEDFINHYRTLPGAVIMSVIYGHDVLPQNDYFVDLADRAVHHLSAAYSTGAFLLDVFPILRYIPTWFPGAAFKRFALEGKVMAWEVRDVPSGNVRKQMKEGKAPNCIIATLLETCRSEEDYMEIASASATSYAGGADTSTSALGTFFLAMAMFPDAHRKAKQEMDAVVGSGRLVTYEDWPSLPHLEAVRREVMRWKPVAPLSIAHASTSDDIYKGYFIPKGATVISNIWAITHDPEKYPEPDAFNPDRFFKQDGKLNDDVVDYVFGFGRRICPGQHVAVATLWLAFATVLQNFDIQKKRNAKGEEIPIHCEYSDGLLSHPSEFECAITPRSAEAQRLILEAVGKDK